MTRCEEYERYEVQRKMRGYERREDDVKRMEDVRTAEDVKTMRTMKTMRSQRMEAVMDMTECSDE
jgi:hypothetical protein